MVRNTVKNARKEGLISMYRSALVSGFVKILV